LKDFSRAIQLNPNSDQAYNNRGLIKQDLGLNKDAIEDFDKAV
jgi:regulator of sirC expression with transglutaminase-like and TPR domain